MDRAQPDDDITRPPEAAAAPPRALPAPSSALGPGAVLGGFVIERLLGQGGCGVVYAAHRRDGAGTVAIKVMHATLSGSPKAVERFVREVSLLRLLRHPSIVDIHDLGKLDDGRPYYVMGYVQGEPLSALIRRRRRIPVEEVVDLFGPICEALAAAHEAGIVHRDVKASNILVAAGDAASAAGRRVKLIDFGIAKLTQMDEEGSGLTTVGRHVGTLSAMAPEQILGRAVDARTDIYALGILLYRLLTGHHPFWSEDEVELAWRHIEAPAPRPSARAPVSPLVDAVVLRCLEKAPERRFESARALFAALCEAAGASAPTAVGVHDGLAAGIHVELSVAGAGAGAGAGVAENLDAHELADLGRALDLVEDSLRAEGFTVALAAGASVLAVRPCPAAAAGGGAGCEADERRAAAEVARALARTLAARQDPAPGVRARVRGHVDRALLRLSGAPELLGGALAEIHAWPASSQVSAAPDGIPPP